MTRLAMMYVWYGQDADLELFVAQQRYNYHNMNNPNWHFLLQCLNTRLNSHSEISSSLAADLMGVMNWTSDNASTHSLRLQVRDLIAKRQFEESYTLLENYRYQPAKNDHHLNVHLIRVAAQVNKPMEVISFWLLIFL